MTRITKSNFGVVRSVLSSKDDEGDLGSLDCKSFKHCCGVAELGDWAGLSLKGISPTLLALGVKTFMRKNEYGAVVTTTAQQKDVDKLLGETGFTLFAEAVNPSTRSTVRVWGYSEE